MGGGGGGSYSGDGGAATGFAVALAVLALRRCRPVGFEIVVVLGEQNRRDADHRRYGHRHVRQRMRHEAQKDQRRDPAGKLVPAWFIQSISAVHAGKTVMSAQWGPSVSKNPFVQFVFKGGKAGDTVAVTWIDNKGDKRTDEAKIT